MDDGERDDLVGEVADALTLDQDVDWERCRRQATPADRRSLDNLRLFAGMFSGSEAAEDASPATNLQPFGGVFARRAMQAVMAFAVVEVSAALLLFLWGWSDIRRDALALQLAFLLVGYSVAGSPAVRGQPAVGVEVGTISRAHVFQHVSERRFKMQDSGWDR